MLDSHESFNRSSADRVPPLSRAKTDSEVARKLKDLEEKVKEHDDTLGDGKHKTRK